MDASERAQAFRFLTRAALFLLPLAALFALPAGVLLLGGELASADKILRLQQGSSLFLYGPAYSDPALYYKFQGVLRRSPEIICLGSSRCLEFRAEDFRRPDLFYNAGSAINRLKHMRKFLARIPPGKEPRLILLGLDQNYLNPRWEDLVEDGVEARFTGADADAAAILLSNWQTIYADYRRGKFTLAGLLRRAPRRLGLNAIFRGNGMRNDGSYCYGQIEAAPDDPELEDYGFRQTLAKARAGFDRFRPSEDVSIPALYELNSFLQDCRLRKIQVAGFLPPYPHAVYEVLRRSGRHGYLANLLPAARPLFERRGFALFDFSDLASLGFGDEEALDGLHVSEKANARMLARMARAYPPLREYADPDDLERRLAASAVRFELTPEACPGPGFVSRTPI